MLSFSVMCCALTFPRAGSAQTAAKEVTIYDGELSLSPYDLGLGGWGSGTAKEHEKAAYQKAKGVKSIEVETNSPFDGMRLDFGDRGEGLDITSYRQYGRLVMRVLFSESCRFGGGGGRGGGGIGRPGGGGPGMPGMPGGPGGTGTTQPREPKFFEHLRVVFYLERGAIGIDRWRVDFEDMLLRDPQGWTIVDLPLGEFKGSPNAGGRVKRILISGDAPTTFSIGQMKLVIDRGPLNVSVLANGKPAQTTKVKLDEDIEFMADVDAGAAEVVVLWDFDENDNLDERMQGTKVKKKFFRADTFKVTVTVIDITNRKPPLTVQVDVKAE
jgi:hypothetical protein